MRQQRRLLVVDDIPDARAQRADRRSDDLGRFDQLDLTLDFRDLERRQGQGRIARRDWIGAAIDENFRIGLILARRDREIAYRQKQADADAARYDQLPARDDGQDVRCFLGRDRMPRVWKSHFVKCRVALHLKSLGMSA